MTYFQLVFPEDSGRPAKAKRVTTEHVQGLVTNNEIDNLKVYYQDSAERCFKSALSAHFFHGFDLNKQSLY